MARTINPFQSTALPISKGSDRLESPVGESLKDFFFRFMIRKEEKTGWRSGRLDRGDTKKPDKSSLAKPFISLFEAMKEAGFVETMDEAEAALMVLALQEGGSMGVRRKDGALRYWTASGEASDF